MPVFEFDPKHRIGEVFRDLALHFNDIFLGHRVTGPESPPP